MRKSFKYLLWKSYFDKGLALTSYVKYLLALFGAYSFQKDIDISIMVLLGCLYLLSCLVIGMLWYHYKLVEVENDINNSFNPLFKRMHKHLSKV